MERVLPTLAKLTIVFVASGGALVFGTICVSLVVARYADSIRPPVMAKLKDASRVAYAIAACMFATGFLGSLLVEIGVGRSSQTSRAGGTLTVLEADSPFLFWSLTAFKGAAVLFAYYLAIKSFQKNPTIG